MRARETDVGFVLDGVIPWVTGGAHAKYIVTGAVLDDGRQLLGVLPTDRPGVAVEPAAEMVGLTATSTGPVRCDGVLLEHHWLLAPVVPDVLKHGKGAGTGGLQTSALALGTISAAVAFLREEAGRRDDLKPIAAELEIQALDVGKRSGGACRRRTLRLHARRRPLPRQRPGPTQRTGGPSRGQGFRLRCRTPGRPLVSRSALLPRLELPATGRHGDAM
ncbi:MAG: hypothetical protein QM775_00185 [Pirellulales bacterium]